MQNRTGPEQETDNGSDNRLTPSDEKHNTRKLVVGWRRGYAPDCKADSNPCIINLIASNPYQDRTATSREPDNRSDHKAFTQKETPSARASAAGGNQQSWSDWLNHTLYRVDATRALSRAILACHPDDAEPLLEEALSLIRAGQPVPPFTSVMAEARNWSEHASRSEIKAYALACFELMPPGDQSAFLHHLDRRATA